MNTLTLSIALLIAGGLTLTALYIRRPIRSRGQDRGTYVAGRIMALLLGVGLVLFGAAVRSLNWPLSALWFPFFAIIGVQVFLWAIGITFGSLPSQQSAFKGSLEQRGAEYIANRREGKGMTFLKKWFHPIYFVTALFLGGLIGHKINMWTNFGPQDPARPYILHSEPWMLITAITILVLVIVKDRYFEARAIRALDDIRTASTDHQTQLTKWIVEHLTPTIISFDNRNDVLGQASSIIDTAISEPHDADRYVMFTGSAALYKDLEDQETDADTPLAKYRSAMARLSNSTCHATRYIALLEPSDFKRRGEDTRADYLKWIDKQITLVERNPNYCLYNCPRAPSWGSSRSSIYTAKALLDIVGNGESGILIRGEQVAQDLTKSTKRLFEINAVVKPIVYNKPSLLKYLKDLKEVSSSETAESKHSAS